MTTNDNCRVTTFLACCFQCTGTKYLQCLFGSRRNAGRHDGLSKLKIWAILELFLSCSDVSQSLKLLEVSASSTRTEPLYLYDAINRLQFQRIIHHKIHVMIVMGWLRAFAPNISPAQSIFRLTLSYLRARPPADRTNESGGLASPASQMLLTI